MKKNIPTELTHECSLQNFTVSRVEEEDGPYKTYIVTIGEDSFTVRKSDDHMWISGDAAKLHGDDILNSIGCYIDNNSI
ncbi:hypothetical protein F0919_15585 [Taibaiella lutea]|uniref:Uncharacterized protein n=1 Tax=Taibaiella lutea TaxID=2608001 RepID=A0A5M6CGH2_9BACT|nr:hypothetical protein [Taibaiella lutea]KAA5532219.1 hypothetical protein F0919_15585 [Taibaiella lutea]